MIVRKSVYILYWNSGTILSYIRSIYSTIAGWLNQSSHEQYYHEALINRLILYVVPQYLYTSINHKTLNKIMTLRYERIWHYNDVIMSAMTSQITSVSIVCSIVGSGADQRKHHSSASMAFVWGIHHWPVNSPHKRPVTRKMFPFDDVLMSSGIRNIVKIRA